MNNSKSLLANKYLEAVVRKYPESFKEFDFEEPLLMWYPDALHVARVSELSRTASSFADWVLGGFEDCQYSFVRDLFCEDFEEMYEAMFKSNMKVYFVGKSKEQIMKSARNIIERLNGATCIKLINYNWSVDTIE